VQISIIGLETQKNHVFSFSALLLKGCYKKQETEKNLLKLQTWSYLQGTYPNHFSCLSGLVYFIYNKKDR
jgi:hypothetical protein